MYAQKAQVAPEEAGEEDPDGLMCFISILSASES